MEGSRGKGRMAVSMLQGLIIAGLMSVILLLIMAFVMLKLQPGPEKMQVCILVTYVLSCFAGGWFCGKRAEKRKYLWGLFLGAVFFLLLFIISQMGEEGLQSGLQHSLISLALCCAGGMLGGMAA